MTGKGENTIELAQAAVDAIGDSPETALAGFVLPDLLYGFGSLGLGIVVRRSNASVADPWQIHVETVTSAWVETSRVMCGLRTGSPLCIDWYPGGAEGRRNSLSSSDDDSDVDDAGESRSKTSRPVVRVRPVAAVEDVLVVMRPGHAAAPVLEAYAKSALHTAYLGVVFCRNPVLALPAQRTALLTVALVQAVNQLLDPACCEPGFVAVVWTLLTSLRARMGINGASPEQFWNGVIYKLMEPHPERRLTEAPEDDVSSVAKVLGPLMVCHEAVDEVGLFELAAAPQLSAVALALLAESISRSSRVYLKCRLARRGVANHAAAMRDEAQAVLARALGISPESVPAISPSDEVIDPPASALTFGSEADIDRALRASSKLFRKPGWTNVPPTAVLACLQMARVVQGFGRELAQPTADPPPAFVTAVCSTFRGLSMGAFLTQFVEPGAGRELDRRALQAALYVQGIEFHSSKLRRGGEIGELLEPHALVASAAARARKTMYAAARSVKLARLARTRKLNARELRRQEKLAALAEFYTAHAGVPKLFSEAEVAAMNRAAPSAVDAVVREPSGLLRHRCCFEACPRFLEYLGTQADRLHGTRKGLFTHLAPITQRSCKVPYFPGWHLMAIMLWRKTRSAHNGRQTFITRLVNHYRDRTSSSAVVASLAEATWLSIEAMVAAD
ncbi:uncharacterized protein AMSG_06439 [Thecamonas trahens ATCC 50062]|uniref:Uncharacterized protein n=1 Tax=Thecamonas trahens ATCC 50062 TaxID=461836 RepID=A0A0L0DDI4_THETB|nr:hypothetical protein AMSG_06439 [Thecamonas trahens ATCC 50062]KNC50280.1 hypothetical protein AMSG_06439 [Thecamonas trahens ATCC 50062]|eukprot:XP_013757107.1 hypothetical protein AMSG_06439 [Thecamonas trahens ATCC 50062]